MKKLDYEKITNHNNNFDTTNVIEKATSDYDNINKLNKSDQIIYRREIINCDGCKPFKECKQENTGLYPIVIKRGLNSKEMTLSYKKCDKVPGEIYGSYIQSIHNALPLYENNGRESILRQLRKGNGGFLYGKAGIGKSTIMLNIAKELHKKGKYIYYEFANNITVMLRDFKEIEKKMKTFQNAEILFIDDFAREVMTGWVILNIFNPILQHRIDNNMPTYITCNYSLTELFKIIEKNTDYVSADAIISRIKTIGNYHLEDKNYRLENK